MSEPHLSKATRDLLRAAKTDAPSAATRANIWSNVGSLGYVAHATPATAASESLAPGPAAGTAAGWKMLTLGTLLGGTIVVGLAAVLLHVGRAPSSIPSTPLATSFATPLAPAPRPSPPAILEAPAILGRSRSPSHACLPGAQEGASSAVHGATTQAAAPGTHAAATIDDMLSREAAMVAEARGAIVRGDPQAALRSIHAARQLSSRQLLPEELAVEAQAYRALGREDEARDADSALKTQFPESALAR